MKHHLTLALLGTLCIAPSAFAQDAGNGSASGKRVSVVGGVALAHPTGHADIGATRADLDGEATGTLSASWLISDNVAVEAWGTDKTGHRISANGRKIGSVDAQPYALSGQYHFGAADMPVRPFVGMGYYRMNYTNETAQAGGPLAGRRMGVETTNGPMATVGTDLNLGEHWFARGDVRYLHGSSDIAVGGVKSGEVKAQPVVVGVGIGTRW